jgi:hypothetical protein
LRKFEQLAKEVPRPSHPVKKTQVQINMAASIEEKERIRKCSIDQISGGMRPLKESTASSFKPSSSPQVDSFEKIALESKAKLDLFDKASLEASKEKFSAHMAKQPPFEGEPAPLIIEFKKSFKPFAKEIKSHLTERKQTIQKEGRKAVVEDFKAFASGFKIPESFKSNESSPKSVTKLELAPDEYENTSAQSKFEVLQTAMAAAKPSATTKIDVTDTVSVVSEAESHTTSATAKSKFKLSATATEFTPSFSAPVQIKSNKAKPSKPYNKISTSPNCKSILLTLSLSKSSILPRL